MIQEGVIVRNSGGGGGGSSFPIVNPPTGAVSDYSTLNTTYPPATYSGYFAWVQNSSGVFFINYKKAGLYYSNGTSWVEGTQYQATAAGVGVNTAGFTNSSANNLQTMSSDFDTAITSKQPAISLTTTGTSGAATFMSNVLNIPQYSGGGDSLDTTFFGAGTDGNVTVSTGTTLTRDMYYATLTLSTGCAINVGGCRIFCSVSTDATNAPAGAIFRNGLTGGTATTNVAVSGAAALAASTIGGSPAGTVSQAGTTGVGGIGGVGALGNNGGAYGPTGAGGNGAGNAGGAGGVSVAQTYKPILRSATELLTGVALVTGGGSGRGGSSGGGDGTNTGRGAGAGGSGGGVVGLWSKDITTSVSTAAGFIQAIGGAGGNGASGAVGNVGGGAGGGAAGGGWVYIVYKTRTGATVTGAIDVSGGKGGNGGNGFGTGTGGFGSGGAAAGRVDLINLTAGTVSDTFGSGPTATVANSGITGGTGNAGEVLQVSL